jgi:hypothetical protein
LFSCYREIAANFNSYEPQVKAKLLISIINIKRSALKGLEEKLKAIFNSASQDKDEWVKVVYHITKTYIKNFTLNTHDFETCGNALELSYKECASARKLIFLFFKIIITCNFSKH